MWAAPISRLTPATTMTMPLFSLRHLHSQGTFHHAGYRRNRQSPFRRLPPAHPRQAEHHQTYSLDDVYLKESSADEWWLRKDEFVDVVEPYIDSRIEEI